MLFWESGLLGINRTAFFGNVFGLLGIGKIASFGEIFVYSE